MYSLFFQSKDAKTLDFALKKSLKKLEKKQTRRASVRKSLNKFKEKVRDTASKDKEKIKPKPPQINKQSTFVSKIEIDQVCRYRIDSPQPPTSPPLPCFNVNTQNKIV